MSAVVGIAGFIEVGESLYVITSSRLVIPVYLSFWPKMKCESTSSAR